MAADFKLAGINKILKNIKNKKVAGINVVPELIKNLGLKAEHG